MKFEMEIVPPPSSFLPTLNWLQDSKSSIWTPKENKLFENALAIFDKDAPDRWQKVAAMIPGKTVGDVIKQYQELEADVSSIEAGLIPVPGYAFSTSPFTLDWISGNGFDEFGQSFCLGGKRSSSGRPVEHERKKGIPWTEEEHKLFLLGLKKYGKGDWRNISRNFVVTRTPTQVASHAQKYFIRQFSGGKDKRRASIHDITTANFTEPITPPDSKQIPSPVKSLTQNLEQSNCMAMPSTNWNQRNSGTAISFNPTSGNLYFTSTFGAESCEQKMQGHSFQGSTAYDSFGGTRNMGFHVHSTQQNLCE